MSTGGAPTSTDQLLQLETCHDLRQPVASLILLAEAAFAEPEISPSLARHLEAIVEQAEWLRDLIEHWLQSGELASQSGQSDLVRLVNEAVATESVAYTGDVKVVWPAESVPVAVDPIVVRRIVANVLANATRAAGPLGSVTVDIGRDEGFGTVVVEDSGPGFGKIANGLGLGLKASARNIVECGGRLEIGRAILGGVRVSLWLPLGVG
jgi:K+-sensing histidine kinase KdpD